MNNIFYCTQIYLHFCQAPVPHFYVRTGILFLDTCRPLLFLMALQLASEQERESFLF